MSYDIVKHCHICEKVFRKKKKHIKLRDHDHYTGKKFNLLYTDGYTSILS